MNTKKLPSTFCWTKMGTEAGEDLAAIIRRKEWERQLGGGVFLWGIGQSLGENAKSAASHVAPLQAFFSPMSSKPKAIDVTPSEVVLWTAWVDTQGQVRPLPSHCFVTSRASLPSGRKKESHYALVCFSSSELTDQTGDICISPSQLCNVTSNKPLGASQVTAVVRVVSRTNVAKKVKSYSVSFTAELQFPYYVQLAQPIVLAAHEVEAIKTVSDLGDLKLWSDLLKCLHSRMKNQSQWIQNELDLDNANQMSLFTNHLNLLDNTHFCYA